MRRKAKQSDSAILKKRLSSLASRIIGQSIDFFSSKLFLYIILVWFVLQGIYFASVIKFGVPPDENYHFAYIKFFAENFPSPFLPHQQGHDVLQEAVRNPFFIYHYLLSFPYKLISGLDNAYIIIRLLNVALGLASLLVLVKLANFTKISALARNLSLFMLVNTLMFTFLFSSISYDNAFVFLSLASFLLLLHLIKKVEALKLLLMLLVLLAGILTKINFLPIALIVCLVFAARYIKSPSVIFRQLRKTFANSKKINYLLLVLIGFLGILFVQRYVFNIVSFRSFAPECQQVRTIEECRRNALFVRNEKVYAANHPTPQKNVIQYSKDWVPLIKDRTYSIFTHKSLSASRLIVDWVQVILLSGLVILIVRWRKIDKNIKILFYISAFYSGVLLIENMHLYNASGRFGFAVHGRYLFCVLPIIYLVWNHLIIERLKLPVIKLAYIIASVLIFFICSFPYFVQKSTPDWYINDKKVSLNEK